MFAYIGEILLSKVTCADCISMTLIRKWIRSGSTRSEFGPLILYFKKGNRGIIFVNLDLTACEESVLVSC